MSGWDEVKITALKLLWAEGHSATEIGRRLHVTRNAVIGKVHRLHLPHHGFAAAMERHHQTRPKRDKGNGGGIAANIIRKRGKAFVKPVVIRLRQSLTAPESLNVALLDLTDRTCRYPTSGERETMLSCGHLPAAGKVYCEAHYAIAYLPVEKRRNAA